MDLHCSQDGWEIEIKRSILSCTLKRRGSSSPPLHLLELIETDALTRNLRKLQHAQSRRKVDLPHACSTSEQIDVPIIVEPTARLTSRRQLTLLHRSRYKSKSASLSDENGRIRMDSMSSSYIIP